MVKIYRTPIELLKAKIEEGTVFIYHDASCDTPYFVEIAGVRNVAGFFRLKDAQRYVEWLQKRGGVSNNEPRSDNS